MRMDKIEKEIDFNLNADNDDAAEMQHFTIDERDENVQIRDFFDIFYTCAAQ
jgi:hypothetical protein